MNKMTKKIKLMGIINVTPDSFYEGSRYTTEKIITEKVEQMLNEGADIIDIGGMSTKPDCDYVTEEEEYKRVIPTVKMLFKKFGNITISLDTFRPNIAKAGCDEGVKIINDISGGDDEMYKVAAQYNADYILMHFVGNDGRMDNTHKYNDILQEMVDFFNEKIEKIKSFGVNKIIVDPGFGFSKTVEENNFVLDHVDTFTRFGYPLLVGISRKSMIYKPLGITPSEALPATLELTKKAIRLGADILRVHDIKEYIPLISATN